MKIFRTSNQSGFTKMDCMCLLGTIAILFLVGTSALGNSRWSTETQSARCRMNLKLLQQAFQLYAEDNDGTLVVNEDNSFGGWVRENMNFNGAHLPNRSAKHLIDPTLGLLGSYTKDAYIYRCPADHSIVLFRGQAYLRTRSISLSGAMGTTRNGLPTSGGWLPSQAGWQVFASISQLEANSPSLLTTFLVEHPDSINDGTFAFQMPGNYNNFPEMDPDRTRWVDFPASFHNGGDSIAFADGSVGTRHWTDQRTVVGPTYGRGIATTPMQPHNSDILWLAVRMSRPRQN